MKLTDHETAVIVAMLQEGVECNGAEHVEDVLEDNMTWATVSDIRERTGFETETVKGVLGSLTKKGLVVAGYENSTTGESEQVLSDEGVEAAWPHMEDA